MKVLVLTCSTGEGHNSAAYAVLESLRDMGAFCEVVDAFTFGSSTSSAILTSSFTSIVTRAPNVFGVAYKAGEFYSSTGLPSPVYHANTLYAKNLHEYISENDFDAVVCTHLFPMEALTYIKRTYELNAKCYAVLTDYTCIPFLKDTDLDAYFLPHQRLVTECVECGMDKSRLYVTGLPVVKRFHERMTKEEARNYLVIPTDRQMYLIMTGGLGCGNVIDLCKEILKSTGAHASIYVLAGRNNDLHEEIQKRFFGDERIQTVTFTQRVNIYMNAADVLISKPGGISSTEAAVANVPLIHAMAIPGCESKNAEFFSNMGMSYYAETAKDAARYADMLIVDKTAAEKMISAQIENIDPHGAEHIAAFVVRDTNLNYKNEKVTHLLFEKRSEADV